MTLDEFITLHDRANAVVLLEGKRNVLEADRVRLTALGRLLASRTTRMIFRSGGADGSDELFSDGVAAIVVDRLEVITPYAGHRMKQNKAYRTIPLDSVDMLGEPEVVYQSKSNRKTEKLIDQFVAGEKNRVTIKAAYIIRDTVKAIGTSAIAPATVGIFYDDLAAPRQGGTGHTMNICEQNGIPVIDQRTWFGWL